jgi:hypothetical protein
MDRVLLNVTTIRKGTTFPIKKNLVLYHFGKLIYGTLFKNE